MRRRQFALALHGGQLAAARRVRLVEQARGVGSQLRARLVAHTGAARRVAKVEVAAPVGGGVTLGSVIGTAKIIGWLSKQAQAFQSGFVRNYALFIAVGFISLLLITF